MFLVTNQPVLQKGFVHSTMWKTFIILFKIFNNNKIKPFEQIKLSAILTKDIRGKSELKLFVNVENQKGMIEEILSEFNLRNKKLELLFIGDTIMISNFQKV